MPEVQKYNLKEKLIEADKALRGSTSLVGKSGMTHFRYNNSTRTQMFTSHLDQAQTQLNPRFPKVCTTMENTVGKHSSGYKKTKGDIQIYRKVVKFEDLIEDPYVYQLFYWDKDKNRFDVYTRNPAKDLSQNYGYMYNNEVIDGLVEGDEVPEGTVLYKSTSYDEDMNYRYGRDLNVIYTLDPYTAEDAAKISEYASEALAYIHSEKFGWNWNLNDIPLNIYGDNNEYRPLPWIGEKVSGYIASSRPQINEQLLYDFKSSNLREIRDSDRTIEYPGDGVVVDYDIYYNGDGLADNSFNHQIIILLEAQTKYWQEIYDTCVEIRNTGKDYSNAVDRLYKKSREFLNHNPKEKWNNGNSVFGNIEFRIWVIEKCKLEKGGKFTARYGNKSVVSKVVKNYEMPFCPNGRRADVELNLLAINNRTTAFVYHEMDITWILELTILEMKKMDDRKEQEKLFFDVIRDLNEEWYNTTYSTFKELSVSEKEEYLDEVMKGNYTVHVDSLISEDESDDIFIRLGEIRKKYDYLKPETMYIYKWGQIYPMQDTYCMGSMYFFPLKQTDQRGFSARNTGAVNMKGLPERSYKNKRKESSFSDTAIRFGEYEAMNFLIGLEPEELAVTHLFYRTSPDATSDLTKAQFVKKGLAHFKKFYKSRAAEIFSVLYKSLSLELMFDDTDDEMRAIDNNKICEHTHDGKTYLCTDWEFYEMSIRDRVRKKVLEENVMLSTSELEAKIAEEMETINILIGPNTNKDLFDNIGDDDVFVSKRDEACGLTNDEK